MNHPDICKMIDETVARLSEHVETVQIFCTIHEGGEDQTCSFQRGRGNMFARIGQVKDWILQEDAKSSGKE